MKQFLRYRILIPLALFLGFSPFYPEPHIVEKFRMLQAGTLSRPIDIFDLSWHSWPLALLGFKVGRDLGKLLTKKRDGEGERQ